ncbi:MAG: ABC transporter ATP-binding protein [Burkholderiales bacterium]|nr:ABC transporter ATP-binding protein [Burkholderiales bacterium]
MFLDVSELQVRYPGRDQAAVERVRFGLEQGQMGVLIGPSGCGKTTLLRAVAGLEPVSGGAISMNGEIISSADVHLAAEKRRIGMVFQDYALFPHLNVEKNIAFGLSQFSATARQARVDEMLSLVGLTSAARRYPHELSGGQQQRVALARALAPEPLLLLLDEPFSNLDEDLRESLAYELREILQLAKITALFVTHDQMEAFALGDAIGVMNKGKLEQWDDAYQLYHRPKTRFAAEFIGHGVFASAKALRQGQHVVLQTPLGELKDVEEDLAHNPIATDGSCEVLLRADDIVHDDEAPVKAEILRKAFRGSEFLYTLRLASGQTVMAHVPSHHDHHVGEWIGIRLQADHVVVFGVTPL